MKRQILTAAVDGVVQQLAVHTVGGVVTAAQQLAVVVPFDAALKVEAMVSNRDIGFVHVGQDAQIKIDTFNFTRYGLLHSQVLSVPQDAIVKNIPTMLRAFRLIERRFRLMTRQPTSQLVWQSQ